MQGWDEVGRSLTGFRSLTRAFTLVIKIGNHKNGIILSFIITGAFTLVINIEYQSYKRNIVSSIFPGDDNKKGQWL